MALEEDIRALSAVSLFSELTGEQLRLLAFGAETMRLSAGKVLYRQNAAADCAFVIVSGSVDLVDTSASEPRVLRSVFPGAILGDVALIAETIRPTGAVAGEGTEVIRINRTLFRRILEEYPDLAARLHARFARELQDLAGNVSRLQPRFDR